MKHVKLINGLELPCLGLGTWQITDRKQMSNVLSNAFDAGYRLFDTAAAYSNEIAIAKALAEKGIERKRALVCRKMHVLFYIALF